MPPTVLDHLADHVYTALKAAFSELIQSNPGKNFYAFGVFTDDSLQFLHPAANTEEALTATVQHYREEVDPKYGGDSTRAGMRWSYGDWGHFADFGEEPFAEINAALSDLFDASGDDHEERIASLWPEVLKGFQKLDQEGFFGTGAERSKVTLGLVGDLPSELVDEWATELNPPDVADRFVNWNPDAPDND